jgi:hypothetical protein
MPENKTSLLQIRMTPTERKDFKQAAFKKGLSESSFARMLIKEGMEREKEKRS